MPRLLNDPTIIEAAGNKPKLIEEFVGPGGWHEPGQTPEFDEFTIVLEGMLRVKSKAGTIDVHAGQAVIAHRGEWVQYSTPNDCGAEYIAVCVPAFSIETVHRDDSKH